MREGKAQVRTALAAALVVGTVVAGCSSPHTSPGEPRSAPTTAPEASAGEAARLAANKRMAVDFYELAVNRKNVREAAARYVAPTYIQHNPNVADGPEAMVKLMEGRYRAAPQRVIQVVRVVAEGDLVVAHSLAKNTPADRGTVFVDIWRVKDGKFVEHWDVSQPVPPTSANGHGMT